MNIIVNGGSSGIGREVVLAMARNSDNQLFVTGRNEEKLKSLNENFGNVRTLAIDLSEFEKYTELFRENALSHFNHVDILINMAGMLVAKDFIDFTDAEARRIMETNFIGPASVIRVLKPLMSKGSHIINISSMGGFQGSVKFKGLSYYSASKAALSCLSECLATEFSDSGISVNCLALGSVQTDMLNEAFPGYKAPITSEKIAEFICSFALTGNRFMNGKVIPVAITIP